MSNRDELLKIQQSWELEQARRDSLRLPGISITDTDSSDAKVDTVYQGSSPFSEMPKINYSVYSPGNYGYFEFSFLIIANDD
mgnify:CR=1 FL=1